MTTITLQLTDEQDQYFRRWYYQVETKNKPMTPALFLQNHVTPALVDLAKAQSNELCFRRVCAGDPPQYDFGSGPQQPPPK